MRRIKHVTDGVGGHYGYSFHCPGCIDRHTITTKPYPDGWDFSGTEERPTFAPSILVYPAKHLIDGVPTDTPRCHSFVRDGRIEFLSDSTHALAGQTVDLPEIP